MKVEMLKNNAFVIKNFETDTIILQSYQTAVVEIRNASKKRPEIVLGLNWNYSLTTLKHVYAFLEEYAPELDLYLNSRNKKRRIEELIRLGQIEYDENLT